MKKLVQKDRKPIIRFNRKSKRIHPIAYKNFDDNSESDSSE